MVEDKINLFLEELENKGIELEKKDEILNFATRIIKSEMIAKEHFRQDRDNALIQLSDIKDRGQ